MSCENPNTELTTVQLVLKECNVKVRGGIMLGDRVVGIVTQDGPRLEALFHKGYDIAGGHLMRAQQLPHNVAEGLISFFASCYGPDASAAPSPLRFLGMTQVGKDIAPSDPPPLSDYVLTRRNDSSTKLEAGRACVIGIPRLGGEENDGYEPPVAIGTSHDYRSLAVLSKGAELFLSTTGILCGAMGVTALHDISLPRFAPEEPHPDATIPEPPL